MASIKTIRDKLVSIVETLEGLSKPLSEVYGYPTQPRTFPCAFVLFTNANEERLDSCRNLTNSTYNIRVLMEAENDSDQETTRLEIVDSLLASFRTTANVDTLDGTVDKFTIDNVSMINADADRPYRYFEITVTGSKIELVT